MKKPNPFAEMQKKKAMSKMTRGDGTVRKSDMSTMMSQPRKKKSKEKTMDQQLDEMLGESD